MSCKPVQWKSDYKTKFLLSLRNFELSNVIFFADDFTTSIAHLIISLLILEVNTSRYQDYYWKIKKLLTGYTNCCYHLTKQVYKIGATIFDLEKVDFIHYISQTRKWQNDKQIQFIESVKIIKLDTHEEIFESKFKEFMTKLDKIEETTKSFDRIEPYCCYLQDRYNETLAWLDDLYEFAADHIGFIIYKEEANLERAQKETTEYETKQLRMAHSKYVQIEFGE